MTDLESIQTKLWEFYAGQYPHIATIEDQTPMPNCPICGGLGVITLEVGIKHPAFGKAFHCLCRRRWALNKRIESTVSSDAIPDDAYGFNFDDFEGLGYAADGLNYARQLARQGVIVLDDDTERYGLMLAGPTGCGKTTLMSIVYRQYVEAGRSAGWWNANGFVKRVQSTYANDYTGPTYEDIIDSVARLDILALDDLGSPTRTTVYSEDHIEILLKVLNYREAHKRITLITSNLNTAQLDMQFGPRIGSRINGLCAIARMIGQDFRIRQGKREAARS